MARSRKHLINTEVGRLRIDEHEKRQMGSKWVREMDRTDQREATEERTLTAAGGKE
jgi:hypothetical protein